MKKRKSYTPEQKVAILARIKTLRANGESLELACKNSGINPNSFYYWNDGSKPKKKKSSQLLTLPMESLAQSSGGKLALVIGSKADLLDFVRSLS